MRELVNDFVVSLEEELTCSLCKGFLTKPKTLHCLHSFCGECIEKWNETCKNQRQAFVCPVCWSREDGDVSKLQSFFYHDSLKQLLLAMGGKASKAEEKLEMPDCVSCLEHEKLVAFCQGCKGLICMDCVNGHKKIKELRAQHQVIMFIDFKQQHVNSYISRQIHCEEKSHEKQTLEYFCQTCHKCICAMCSNADHDKHTKIHIEKKVAEIKEIITENLVKIKHLKRNFDHELELSKQNLRRVETEMKRAKEEVHDHIQAQIKILKDHENEITKAIENMFLEQKLVNDEEQNEINAIIQQLDAVNNLSKRLQSQNIDYFILQSQLPQRYECLLQKPSVLSSKPVRRNTCVHYIPNSLATQSFQDFGKIEENVVDPSCCYIELQKEEAKCGFLNTFEIVTKTSKGEVCYTNKGSIDVKIEDMDGLQVDNQIVEHQTGKYFVTYKAEKPSPYQIVVSIAGNEIDNSPVSARTLDTNKTDLKSVQIIGEEIDFNVPVSLAVNENHQTAIVDKDNHRVVIYSKDGTYLWYVGGKAGAGKEGELRHPFSVTMCDDTIIVCDNPDANCSRIQEFDVNGAYLRTIYRQEGVGLIRMCTSDTDVISVISYSKAHNKNSYSWQVAIKLFSKHSGQFIKDIPISTVTRDTKELPYFIAYYNNKYFLSYTEKNSIGVYDDQGGLLTEFGSKGKKDGQFDGVGRLAVYGDDRLLVCDSNNHRVQVFTHNLEFVTSFGSRYSIGRGKMNGPTDVVVTSDGKVYVLECGGKRVHVWR